MSRKLPPLKSLRYFDAAAKSLSFTRAAAELFVTQSAVSHQVKALEEYLGVALFIRKNRRLHLTEEGQTYWPAVRKIFEQLADATEQLKSSGASGPLTVSVAPSFAVTWLVPRLNQFNERFPDIDVRMKADDELADFVRDDVDMQIFYGHQEDYSDDLYSQCLLEEKLFKEKVPYTYVADGHHRTAAAAGMSEEFKKENPNHTGKEPYNYFMAVHFPDNQLQIIDYNRVVKDLNGLSTQDFLKKIEVNFTISEVSEAIIKPTKLHDFSMYLNGKWYGLTAKPNTFDDNNPIDSLDVSVLSKFILEPVLNIKDLRTDTRIEFIGGIRGLGELSKRVDKGEMAVAFALFPVSMKQLMNIADTNNIMPPKVTWFEPKLRSGLVINKLD